MKSKTQIILTIMNVVAWIAFVGFMIKAGALLTSYVVSIRNPESAKNLYMRLNLYGLKEYDFGYYTGIALSMVALEVLKAYIAFLVTRVLSKIKMVNPFTMEVSKILEKISYFIILQWVFTVLVNGQIKWVSQKVTGLEANLIPEDFLLFAGIVFVMAQIFKKGVEIQTENELTV
jgi:Protein of unknown function (DUF2975)